MQQSLLIDGDRDVMKRDMIPKIRIDEEELLQPDSDDNKDVSRIYVIALHNTSKRTTAQISSIHEDPST